MFSKLDIKDRYWRMVVKAGQHLNFAYVLPVIEGGRAWLVIPLMLQMSWSKYPPFFCVAAKDVVEDLTQDHKGSLPTNPLKYLMLPPSKFLDIMLSSACTESLDVMKVYIDDVCTMVHISYINHLQHISRSLLHTIYNVFQPPDISGLDGEDLI